MTMTTTMSRFYTKKNTNNIINQHIKNKTTTKKTVCLNAPESPIFISDKFGVKLMIYWSRNLSRSNVDTDFQFRL